MSLATPGEAGLIEAMLHAVLLVEAGSLRVTAANRRASEMFGRSARELVGCGMLSIAATPEDLCFWSEVAAGSADTIESETFARRFDGDLVPVLRRVTPMGAGAQAGFVVALHDRSAETEAQRRLDLALTDLQATLESTADGILVTDLAGRIRHCNQRFAALWGMPDELLAQRDDDAVLDWMRRSVTDPHRYMRRLAAMDDATMLQARDLLQLHSGKTLERIVQPQLSRGRPIGRVFSFRDLSAGVEAAERIETLSHCDAVTGLPNRQRLVDRIDRALAAGQREGTPFALLFVDLDRFAHINETLGHASGDRVLAEVAQRIQGGLRQADSVARLHGDEFVVLLPRTDARGAEAIARRLLDMLHAPHQSDLMAFTVTASVGIAAYPGDGAAVEVLLASAEAAMRDAKEAGRGAVRLHRQQRGAGEPTPRSAMQLDHAMRQALVHGRFRLHYQPQIDLADGHVCGAEALIRWRDPERGDIAPGEFIPAAEASGFIVPIGEWVLRQAVQQAAAWRQQGRALVVSVNVSALQFQQPGFVDGVAAALRAAHLPPEWLELELTESILLRDAQEALLRLHALAKLGVRLAVDDFGSGYSSLAYLKKLPIARLKIDRSFVSGLPDDVSDAGIVRAVVQMGRALGLSVVAEGVETEAQRAFLREIGCGLFQGFLVAPALPPQALEALLDQLLAAA